MSTERFGHLLSLVGPTVTRQTTNFREPISAGERLAITLRYLVTGDSMQTISFSYRVGHSTVCGIIDSTCDALWTGVSPDAIKSGRMEANRSGFSTALEYAPLFGSY